MTNLLISIVSNINYEYLLESAVQVVTYNKLWVLKTTDTKPHGVL